MKSGTILFLKEDWSGSSTTIMILSREEDTSLFVVMDLKGQTFRASESYCAFYYSEF